MNEVPDVLAGLVRAEPEPVEPQIQVSHVVTTYFKRPKGQPGVTQMGTRKVDTNTAIDWILGNLPDGACQITFDSDEGGDKTIITLYPGKSEGMLR